MTDKTTAPAGNPLDALKIDTEAAASEAAPELAPFGPPSKPYGPTADHGTAPQEVRVTHVQPVPFGGVVEYFA